jgi:3-methylcrotonyl-CoA carboxylase alpha subunit
MFAKILVANRGEIACRVIRTAKALGIQTVAVYSDADANALHVQMADEAVHIGGSAPTDSYLMMDNVIAAAGQTGSEAIHPGYGFLSENAAFCQLCEKNDLVFIGPPVGAIEAMGSKSAAKKIMEGAGVPLLPGYHGADQDPQLLKNAATDIGYPVLLKAVSGGGGKGMRQVHSPDEFDQALAAARREALSGFGDDDMLVEKYLQQPRHVEVQVFCDASGNGVYLFERDCSVQRRHQKIIEEAPAPKLPDGVREKMGEAALRAAAAVNYVGAGTVEFLLNASGDFYFMEMNTRLQVEHPVTEMITGQDLVEWQLKIANGEPLPCSQSDLNITGHAFEARIYAEDPANEFLPAAGKVVWLQQPQASRHVRVDTGVATNDEVGVFYDPMIAKLIVWDENRERALARLDHALASYRIIGVTTNINFLRRLITHTAFRNEELSTDFISVHQSALFEEHSTPISLIAPVAGLYLTLRHEARSQQTSRSSSDPTSPWHAVDHWRMNAPRTHVETIVVNDTELTIAIEQTDPHTYLIKANDDSFTVSGSLQGHSLTAIVDGHKRSAVLVDHDDSANTVISMFSDAGNFDFNIRPIDLGEEVAHDDGSGFKAPMNGTVVEVLVKAGDQVAAGDTLVIMEAMKMEHAIKAPVEGLVSEIYYGKGDLVDGGADLLAFEPAES